MLTYCLLRGLYDAFSAKLIEGVGFQAVYMSGFGTAASVLGLPDIGLLTNGREMVGNAGRIANAVDIPVIAGRGHGVRQTTSTSCERSRSTRERAWRGYRSRIRISPETMRTYGGS